MTADRQLLLPLRVEPGLGAADFVVEASNEDAWRWLDQTPNWPDRRLLLWGQPGCGKTHLLRIWASRVGADIYDGAELHDLPIAPLSGPIAIDGADAVPDDAALLHLLNAARDAEVPVLLTARVPLSCFQAQLPDLLSRLRAITAVEIKPPEDTLLQKLLAHLLADRQVRVDLKFQDWLLVHLPRTPAKLRDSVDRLNEAALIKGGKIDHKLAKTVLKELFTPNVDDAEADETATSTSSTYHSPDGTASL